MTSNDKRRNIKKSSVRSKHYPTIIRRVFGNTKNRALAVIILVAGVGSYLLINTFAGTYSGTTVFSDNFERSTLGTNWSVVFGSAGIVNNSDLGFQSVSPAGIVSWTGSTLSADQFSEGLISSNKVKNMLTQVSVRRRSSDGARYAFHYNEGPNVVAPGWEIKYDGVPTAQTRILATNRTPPAPKPGDRLRLEVRNSNPVSLKGYLNGVLVLSATDSSASRVLNGSPSLVYRLQLNTTTTYPTAVWESWTGGSLTSNTTTTPPPAPQTGH